MVVRTRYIPSVTCLLGCPISLSWHSQTIRRKRMCIIISRLTILFEDPFWIGLYEREYDGKYEVCKITFGSEPKDYEVYSFMLSNWGRLKFSPALTGSQATSEHINPKRMQRIIKRQLKTGYIGTKAQQALKLQHEQIKTETKTRRKAERELENKRKFELRQKKKKERHRGH